MLFVLNQQIDSVQRDTSVIADNSASAVSVGQTRYNSGMAGKAHFGGVYVEHALIMRFSVFCKYFNHLGVYLVAVFTARVLSHSYSAEGLKRTLEGLIGLKAYNLFKLLIEITRLMRGYGRNDFRVHIEHAARLAFFF